MLNWRTLVDLVENTELEKYLTLCLVRMHKLFPKNKQYHVPIMISSRYGAATLLKLILGQIDMVAKSTSMQIKDFLGTKAFDIKDMAGVTAPLGFFDPAGVTTDKSEGKIR